MTLEDEQMLQGLFATYQTQFFAKFGRWWFVFDFENRIQLAIALALASML